VARAKPKRRFGKAWRSVWIAGLAVTFKIVEERVVDVLMDGSMWMGYLWRWDASGKALTQKILTPLFDALRV
jgi:hypothetical protein